ncbi:MAG: Coenzyme PQQ synthesis protein E [Candidatus Methanophagaceae archaeon]|nr:MAG: Coenzyme PQQ synthesis protein E [Methanophagales archaeon]KAF5431777.1 Radical SAM superfamily enzyme [Methanophagales archaeon]
MPQNFLDLHIVDYCQLNCKHCYLNKGNRVMPLDMLESICEDFLKTDFPLPQSELILSGGEPLLHPNFIKACDIVRKLNGHITMSTNGLLIPKYIHTFQKNDGIQVSIDGDQKAHDFIRGKGSYEKAVKALKLLDEKGIRHTLSFTINEVNKHCVDPIIDLCVEIGAHTLNFNIYQPIRNNALKSIRYTEWIEIRKYVKKQLENEGIYLPEGCIEGGCIARILGLSVLPDGTYWDCSRNQKLIGKYPQPIREVLLWDNLENQTPRNPFETCCRNLEW